MLRRHRVGITWTEPGAMARSAHAVADARGRVWMIDPFEDAEALSAVAELGEPAGVLQLLDRHNRDCHEIAARLEVPLSRLPIDAAGTPFTPIQVLNVPGWHEVALWWAQESVLIVAETVGTSELFGLGRRLGVHPLLRLHPPRRQLTTHEPDLLLVGHGPALESEVVEALEEAFESSLGDIPKLVATVPRLLRGL
jgi:hypothetical protein